MGSPSFPVYGYDVRLLHEASGQPVPDGEKGVVAIAPPLPPGCMSTVWGDDERFVETYFKDFKDQLIYSTFDWGIRDKDGYYFILGRTEDRKSTRLNSSHSQISYAVFCLKIKMHIFFLLKFYLPAWVTVSSLPSCAEGFHRIHTTSRIALSDLPTLASATSPCPPTKCSVD